MDKMLQALVNTGARILMWDIETLPFISMHWGMWQQNINSVQIIKDVSIICISYKWLDESKVHTLSIGDDLDLFKKDPYIGGRYVAEEFIPIIYRS